MNLFWFGRKKRLIEQANRARIRTNQLFRQLKSNAHYKNYAREKLIGIALIRTKTEMALDRAKIFDPRERGLVIGLLEAEHIRTMQKRDMGVDSDGPDDHFEQSIMRGVEILGARRERRFSKQLLKVHNELQPQFEENARRQAPPHEE